MYKDAWYAIKPNQAKPNQTKSYISNIYVQKGFGIR